MKTNTPSVAGFALVPVHDPVHSALALACNGTVVSGAPWKVQVEEHW